LIGEKPRVLLVEDEWLIAFGLEELVRELGYDVVGPVPSVPLALALLEKEQVHIAILDVNLGLGMKSFPIAEALKVKRIPFLFVSGYHERDLPAEFSDAIVCSKPYTEDTLRKSLAKISDQSRRAETRT
jgi:two-component SAPR family response regulator